MLGRVIDLLPDYMLRRLAKADGAWNRGRYRGCERCLVGHAVGLFTYRDQVVWRALPETALLRALSGGVHDNGWVAIGGCAEEHYMRLGVRFGDERIGRLIERRAARVLAERAAERDLAGVEVADPIEEAKARA